MKIGILQTGHAPDEIQSELGDYAAMFARLLDGHGFTFQSYDVVDDVFPGSVVDCDGWLITGSRHGAYEDLPWIPKLELFIQAVDEAGLPLIGVCFGHQIIAQALGGTVEKFDGGWIAGPQAYDFGDAHIRLHAWHQDQVVTVPKGAEVIASTPTCANAALVIGSKILTIQPHPEFGATMIKGLLELRAPGLLPDDLITTVTSEVNDPIDNALFAEKMAQHFKEAQS